MAELSFITRLVLTLLLSALSLFIYKWLQTPSSRASRSSAKRFRKRSKKKPAKKNTTCDSFTPPQQSPQKPQLSEALSQAPSAKEVMEKEDDMNESDSDDGCTAAQVLAKRNFKPASLGGSRLAHAIKASLPPIDAPKFTADQNVLARFGGGDRWFPATVLEQRKGNTYHLKYDDGEAEFRVPAEFIKLQSEKSQEEEGNDSNDVAKAEEVADKNAAQKEASDLESSASDDDGWQVVGASSAAKHHARRLQAAALAEPLVDGLTKRQRENRRKKERQREKKELLRQHAQKDDLDARARWRYVPS